MDGFKSYQIPIDYDDWVEELRGKLAGAGGTFRVALQRQWEISRLYDKFVTPLGYLIDPRGRVASTAAAGAPAILALIVNDEHAHRDADQAPRASVH